jgi:subtilisin family serine protease
MMRAPRDASINPEVTIFSSITPLQHSLRGSRWIDWRRYRWMARQPEPRTSNRNNVGVRGFAPAAEIHACKIFPGGQISQLIDALEYCIEKQVDIVNLSLGTDQVSEVLEQQLLRLTNVGIACIVAAGNSGGPVQYPASSPNVLAVAAIGHVAEFP